MGSFVIQEKKNVMAEVAQTRINRSNPRTAQGILSEIMKKWCEDLDNVILPKETKVRMSNLLLSEHRNYKFFRSEVLTLIDFALRKGVIK